MKTIVTTLAIAALALVGTAPQAAAHPHHPAPATRIYISGYRSCGTPVYMERYFIGYDPYGNPVWGERLVPPPCRPPARRYDPAPYPQAYDPGPDRTIYREPPYRAGGIVIQGYFGR